MTEIHPPPADPVSRDPEVEVPSPSGEGASQKPVFLAGLCVALALGGAWAAVTILFSVKVGFLAWAIGIAVGTTLILKRGIASRRLGLMALALTLLGLGCAKILVDRFHTVPLYYAELEDPEAARNALAVLDLRERFDLEDYNALWFMLALGSAWILARGRIRY